MRSTAALGGGGILELPAPVAGATVTEPHVAIDPSRPQRIAAAAMVDPEGGRVPRFLYLWQTDDGGTTWRGERVEQPQFDNEGAVDAFVGFSADGTAFVAGMAMQRKTIEAVAHGRKFDRATIPLDSWMDVLRAGAAESGYYDNDTVTFVRVDGAGRSLDGTVIRPSAGGDKPVVAVDHYPDSPFYGSIYVAWMDPGAGTLHLARSTDGGKSFGAPVLVVPGPPWGHFIVQLGVRPDGSLHAIWTGMLFTPADAPPEASTSIAHCVSTDGGRTFSEPAAIARHAGLDLIGLPSMAVAPDGEMMVVWGQGTEAPANPLAQVRHRLSAIRSDDGKTWSEPSLVCAELPPSTAMGFPALAATDHSWWILAYLADDDRTDVALLRASRGAASFTVDRTLATRPFGGDDVYLHGNYVLTHCTDVVNVGDYMGLAGLGSEVAAIFILPATDEPLSMPTAYASVFLDA